jgi:hypothetical protein
MRLVLGRVMRDVRALAGYPMWLLRDKAGPDNHYYKKKRVLDVASQFECETFIETGTFYGQMVACVREHFQKVLSVELHRPLYELNRAAFAEAGNVSIYFGDSSSVLKEMIQNSEGRILFWLDGHFSGSGTARGDRVSPLLDELSLIAGHDRRDHCILIDDARLFGTDDYPSMGETRERLLQINKRYSIEIDRDCVVATPA